MFHDEDEELKARHSCTDGLCCLVFLASLAGLGCLYGYGVMHGEMGKLYHGIDYQGKICGLEGPEGVPGKPYLFWCMNSAMTAADVSLNLKDPVCVSSCPGVPSVFGGSLYAPVPECKIVSASQQINSYKTMVVMNRYCFPDSSGLLKSAADSLESGLSNQHTERFLEQLSSIPAAWPVLLIAFFLAVLLGYIYLVALRHCTVLLIWLVMAFSIAGSALLGFYLWANAGTLSRHLPSGVAPPEGYGDNEELVTKVMAGLCWVLSAISGCVACCFRQSIEAAVDCIEEACEAIQEMSSLLLAPILKALCRALVFGCLLYGFFALLSTAQVSKPVEGGLVYNAVSNQMEGVARHFQFTSEQKAALIAYAFVAIWVECWLNALFQFIIAYAMAEYHLSPKDNEGGKVIGGGCCALFDGLQVGLIQHGGSLAMGSFLVTIFWALQMLVAVMDASNKGEGNNALVDCMLKCMQCCLDCFRNIVEFLNKNAYVDMAMKSQNYCASAREAVSVIAQLPVAMAVLNGATMVFTLFGALFSVLSCAALTFFLTTTPSFSAPDAPLFVDQPVAVAVAAGFIGGAVSLCFMTVFDMATDSLLYYYGLDWLYGRHEFSQAPDGIKELMHSGNSGKGGRQ
ncbi:slc44a5a [Symbiodinium pilosum]|uniref:Choline transporter-like protein n=1 Tax=Symbiodinium pilosum TaxID=2952 RepID=A0A812LMG4_SYMPI|nr:slc44a5a [Symbiodinium pilosum]